MRDNAVHRSRDTLDAERLETTPSEIKNKTMRLRSISIVFAAFVIVGCSDVTGPMLRGDANPDLNSVQDERGNPSVTPGMSRWQTDGKDQTKLWLGDMLDSAVTRLASAPDLEVYRASFTVVQGQETVFDLHYKDAEAEAPFMRVEFPSSVQLLDAEGHALRDGEIAQITIEVDSHRFHVRFETDGFSITEDTPVTITFDMSHADIGARYLAQAKAWHMSAASNNNA